MKYLAKPKIGRRNKSWLIINEYGGLVEEIDGTKRQAQKRAAEISASAMAILPSKPNLQRRCFVAQMALKDCPFCGGGDTISEPDSKHWTGMRYNILSWHVRHWCGESGSRFASVLTIRGKTQTEAEHRWNTRATDIKEVK